MKEIKKRKFEKLEFYIVKEEYIKYLNKYDLHVAYNKDENRPYVGVVLEIGKMYYFAPLFSPKPQHLNYKENFAFFKIVNDSNDNMGIIKFSSMIPVPIECLEKFNLEDKHNVVYIENNKAKEDLEHFNLKVRTMGRGYEQDTEFFEAASTAAYYLMEVCNGSRRENHK